MDIHHLLQKHQVQIRLLKQIEHFENLKQVSLQTLDNIPDSMQKTSRKLKQRTEKYQAIIHKLSISYHGLTINK